MKLASAILFTRQPEPALAPAKPDPANPSDADINDECRVDGALSGRYVGKVTHLQAV